MPSTSENRLIERARVLDQSGAGEPPDEPAPSPGIRDRGPDEIRRQLPGQGRRRAVGRRSDRGLPGAEHGPDEGTLAWIQFDSLIRALTLGFRRILPAGWTISGSARSDIHPPPDAVSARCGASGVDVSGISQTDALCDHGTAGKRRRGNATQGDVIGCCGGRVDRLPERCRAESLPARSGPRCRPATGRGQRVISGPRASSTGPSGGWIVGPGGSVAVQVRYEIAGTRRESAIPRQRGIGCRVRGPLIP
jgi:hypothetical protein